MKEKLCIFAGTAEGRSLTEALRGTYELTVCVATDYGKELLDGVQGIHLRAGRMDAAEMERFFRENAFSLVIDATHPYAFEVSENLRAACAAAELPLLRILRETETVPGAVTCHSAGEAARFLAGTEGNILLTTGTKELSFYSGLDPARLWARVLPAVPSLLACQEAGLLPSHVIAMQGPFSQELNEATLRQTDARWLVTRAAGSAGGFEEKIRAAKNAGATPVIIARPSESGGVPLDEALRTLLPPAKHVTLIGIGPGSPDALTWEAKQALESCDAVIGAGSVLENLRTDKPKFAAFLPEDVKNVLEAHRFQAPVVVFRGDTGFFSGAAKLRAALPGYEIRVLPGLASPVYFAARLGIPWEDCKLLSLHGREAGLVRAVTENRRVMALTGGENSVSALCRRLCAYGYSQLPVTVGERLSYPDERIVRGTALELAGRDFGSLSILFIENPDARKAVRHGIPDSEFLRGGAPMTKAEVRSVCLSKLALEEGSVVWDIGAGTGSVSVECALAVREGRVFAVEKEPEACALIRQNARKFRVENLSVVEGTAPQVLASLPAPTHVFLGGSSGSSREILSAVLDKNPAARIAAAAVTLETQAELTALLADWDFAETEIVTVSVARGKNMGRYHLMSGQNPVTVFTMQGAKTDG